MIETCIKNCPSIPPAVNKSLMDAIVQVSSGKRGYRAQDEALRLIQSWGRMFEKRRHDLPIFYDTYMHLKTKGVQFPPLEPQDEVVSNASTSSSQNKRTNE